MDELIRRQVAIDAVMDEFKRIPTNAIRAKTRIEALPPAQPELSEEDRRLLKKLRSFHNGSYAKVIDRLMSAQPEIIHCKDCKHFDPIYTGGAGVCGHWNAKTDLAEVGMDDTISRQAAIYIASGYCHPANIAKELAKLPPAEPEIIRCRDCVNHKDHRCTVANHHVSEKESCAEVFGAKRRTK